MLTMSILKKLIVLALFLSMVASASAGVVYEQLNAGVFDGTRTDTLPDNLNIGAEEAIYFEFQDAVFDQLNPGCAYFAMEDGGANEIAILFRNVTGSQPTISPYMWSTSAVSGGDVTNSAPHIAFIPTPGFMHSFLYSWKAGERVYAELDGVVVLDAPLEVLPAWTTDGQHWLGSAYNQANKLTATMGDVRIYDHFVTFAEPPPPPPPPPVLGVNATVGVYYFEGWYHDTPGAIAAFANAELRNDFPEREPIWGGGLWRGDTVEVMEQQIDLAAENGIAFFSFDWYWYGSPSVTLNDGINSGLKNFMLASNRNRMRFNINICDASPTAIGSDAKWEEVADMLLPYLQDSQYLRVGGNPLITNFNAAGMTLTNYNYFQQIAAAVGLDEIEFAANVAGSTSIYTHVTRYNAVPGWGAGETEYPYQSLVEYMEGASWTPNIWDTESGLPQSYIPTIMAGWDARPWNTPPSWYFNPTRTPVAVAAHLQNAIDWIDDNPTLATPERLVMIYAWNELGEGGYIVPTLGDPTGLYLDAIKEVVFFPEDINSDGIVDGVDLRILTNQWLGSPGDPSADIAPTPTDGVVNFLDFANLAQQWSPGPEPQTPPR